MALTTTNIEFDTTKDDRPDLPPPPDVAITPTNDLWPRPYYLENGLRRVAPYHYTYNTYCKARWRGREILDIFSNEFRDRSKEYYEEAIQTGQIVLNGKPCEDVHTIVKNGDVISHTMHRHEPPVSAQPIRVVHETEEMIVIDKPAGVPVHPSGRYNYNSVVEIMRAERYHAFNPLPCNRLDRLTSGVMFIGKTGKEAEKISAKLRERTVRKEYIARVKGRFPDGKGWEGDEMKGGIVKCEEPILQVSPVLGLNRARASGKTAKTLFKRIAYYPPNPENRESESQISDDGQAPTSATPVTPPEDEGYSIVHCLPLTGRTHQIRVHLQFLGHPISNDPIYSNRRVFGETLGKGDSSGDHDDDITARLGKMGKTEIADAYSYNKDVVSSSINPSDQPAVNTKTTTETEIEIDLTNLTIEQTMQTTPSQLAMLRAQELHRKYGPSPDYVHLHHGSLHAGPLPSTTSSNPTDPSLSPSLLAAHTSAVSDYTKRKGEKLTGHICPTCQTPLYSDPGPHELGIYLHALAYADLNGTWRHTSPMPTWTGNPDGGMMEVPQWDFEALGEEAYFDVEMEKDEAARRNRRGEVKNKGLDEDGMGEGGV